MRKEHGVADEEMGRRLLICEKKMIMGMKMTLEYGDGSGRLLICWYYDFYNCLI